MMCMNEHEFDIMKKQVSNLDEDDRTLFVTQGSDGVKYRVERVWRHIRAAKARAVDPTGCGDAFRAGLIHSHLNGCGWEEAIHSGCIVAAVNCESEGTQLFSLDTYEARFVAEWGYSPSIQR